jgi:hypothetical protein
LNAVGVTADDGVVGVGEDSGVGADVGVGTGVGAGVGAGVGGLSTNKKKNENIWYVIM